MVALSRRAKRFWVKYSLLDWICFAVVAAIVGGIQLTTPNNLAIPGDDMNRVHAWTFQKLSSQVPDWLLFVLAIVLPACGIVVIFLINRKNRYSGIDLNNGILGLLLTAVITLLLSEVIKRTVGAPRPNFYMYCDYHSGACHAPSGDAKDARMAFPSGHAALSCACLLYFSYYLLHTARGWLSHHLPVYTPVQKWAHPTSAANPSTTVAIDVRSVDSSSDEPGPEPVSHSGTLESPRAVATEGRGTMYQSIFSHHNNVLLYLLCFAPMWLALWISITRVQDYWHDKTDIFAGALLGLTVGSVIFNIKFPSVWKGVPRVVFRSGEEHASLVHAPVKMLRIDDDDLL